MMMYSQLNFISGVMHRRTPSKVVMHTSNLPGYRLSLMIYSLCSFRAIRFRTLHCGSHFWNSFIQFPTTDFGIMIK